MDAADCCLVMAESCHFEFTALQGSTLELRAIKRTGSGEEWGNPKQGGHMAKGKLL